MSMGRQPSSMWKRPDSFLVIGAAAVLAVGLGVASASASAVSTWTVKPGGAITGTSGTTTLTDTSTGGVIACKSSKVTAILKTGSGLPGAGIASIKSATFGTCVGYLEIPFTLTSGHLPWSLNAATYKSGVTSGTITGIHATLTGTGCIATVDGTSATANDGKVSITYTNSTGDLKVTASGGNLHLYKANGCAGLFNSGDSVTLSADYAIEPGQTITSP